MSTEHGVGIRRVAWINIAAGATMVGTPLVVQELEPGPFLNALLTGIVVASLAAYNRRNVARHRTELARGPAMWNLLLGLWAIVSGFVVGAGIPYITMMGLLGIVVLFAAAYNLWAAADARRHVVGVRG